MICIPTPTMDLIATAAYAYAMAGLTVMSIAPLFAAWLHYPDHTNRARLTDWLFALALWPLPLYGLWLMWRRGGTL